MQWVEEKMIPYYPLGVYKDIYAEGGGKMKTCQILFAGFGGQGILFAGKFLAYKGLLAGTAGLAGCRPTGRKCAAARPIAASSLSDAPVGSPIVDRPDVLVVMNLPRR